MADPPSSAISNWNPPRETGTYKTSQVPPVRLPSSHHQGEV
jgi:hypothetical protein